MAKYGVCINLPDSNGISVKMFLTQKAGDAWFNCYEFDDMCCWTQDISDPGIAKYPTLNKAEKVMLSTPANRMSVKSFPKVFRF